MSLIQVAQDSAAVILYDHTPAPIQILYTMGLEACTGIVAKGERGVALIHDGGKLTESSLVNVMRKIGNIQFWTTVYNLNYSAGPELEAQEYFKKHSREEMAATNFNRIKGAMEKLNAAEKYQAAPHSTAAGIDRLGNLFCSEPYSIPVKQLDLTLRLQTEILRNGSHLLGTYYDCSLQYDGMKFLPIPKIPKIDKVIKAAEETNNTYRRVCAAYRQAKQDYEKYQAMLEEIMEKYNKAASYEQALRRAADMGNVDDITTLWMLTRVDINAKNATGQTALYYATLKGHLGAIAKLKEFGAKDDI